VGHVQTVLLLCTADEKLRKKMQSGAGFRQVICKLPEPFTVRIEERRPTKRPRDFDYYLMAEVEGGVYRKCPFGLKDPASPGFDYVERLLLHTEFPQPLHSAAMHNAKDRRPIW